MKLNYDLYKITKDKVQDELDEHDVNSWNIYSYQLFSNHHLNSIKDFWKVVAFAYSWMPTIPTIYYDKIEGKEEKLFNELKNLQKCIGDNRWLFTTLVPVINNSVVGTSKALHFIAPYEIPIYDSRVIRAWSKLFKKDKSLRLQYKTGGEVGKVLFYIKKMHEWLDICKSSDESITLRDLELILYYYGEK